MSQTRPPQFVVATVPSNNGHISLDYTSCIRLGYLILLQIRSISPSRSPPPANGGIPIRCKFITYHPNRSTCKKTSLCSTTRTYECQPLLTTYPEGTVIVIHLQPTMLPCRKDAQALQVVRGGLGHAHTKGEFVHDR